VGTRETARDAGRTSLTTLTTPGGVVVVVVVGREARKKMCPEGAVRPVRLVRARRDGLSRPLGIWSGVTTLGGQK
jgi:hypothetical protein